jgi:hypothetical protein
MPLQFRRLQLVENFASIHASTIEQAFDSDETPFRQRLVAERRAAEFVIGS